MVGGRISKIVISLDPHKGFCEAIHQKKAKIFLHQLIYDTWQNNSFYNNGKFIIDFSPYIFLTQISHLVLDLHLSTSQYV